MFLASRKGGSAMERDKQADLLRGYACLLVVIGHVFIGVRTSGIAVPGFLAVSEKFIWSFHIDLFMFLSGYVFSLTGGAAAKGGRRAFLLGKLLSLGVPYLIFSCLYAVVNSLTPGVNNSSSVSDVLSIWYKPIAQYWFLFALFWLFVIWAVISKPIKSNALITALLYTFFIVCKCFKINLGFLDSSFNCVLAFGLGTCIKSLNISRLPKAVRAVTAALHIAAAVILINFNLYTKLFIDDILTVFGIFSSLCFISLISRLPAVSKALGFICVYSFPLYLTHTFFTAGARIILLRLGVTNCFVHIAAGIAAGLLFPIAAAKAAELSPFLNFFFYPARAVKEIRAGKYGFNLRKKS